MKLALGMGVGLGPGDFVLDGDPAPSAQKGGGAPSPIFGPFLLLPNGCMDQDASWYAGCWVRLYSVHATLTLTLRTEVLHL